MTPEEVRARAQELIDIIKRRFVRPDGLLARSYPPGERTLFDNFDDIVPFFLYFGEDEFLLGQIHAIAGKGESMLSLVPREGVVRTRELDEWIGGLYALYKATGDKECFRLLSDSVSFILENLIDGDLFSAACLPPDNRPVRYWEPWSAGLLEVFCEARDDFPMAFERSLAIMRRWISGEYFREHGLFPYLMPFSPVKRFLRRRVFAKNRPVDIYRVEPSFPSRPGPKALAVYAVERARFETASCWYSHLMKSNTTAAFCLLEFYQAAGDKAWLGVLFRWIDSALAAFCEGGKVFMEYFPLTGERKSPSVSASFILADVLLDTAAVTGRAGLIERARLILGHQLNRLLPNGLAPVEEGGSIAHLDNQVDLSITLRRYAELSGDTEYAERSRELIEQAIAAHYSPKGYLTHSGPGASEVIDPKYNALLLKGMINLLTPGERIYPGLRDIFKDR